MVDVRVFSSLRLVKADLQFDGSAFSVKIEHCRTEAGDEEMLLLVCSYIRDSDGDASFGLNEVAHDLISEDESLHVIRRLQELSKGARIHRFTCPDLGVYNSFNVFFYLELASLYCTRESPCRTGTGYFTTVVFCGALLSHHVRLFFLLP
ncbi:hypothetical protein C5167_015953 [Papaver somniferum]|nr:hypothetical protein C5167_015953 [Papaver somniferum]